jgi:hypothetical protein
VKIQGRAIYKYPIYNNLDEIISNIRAVTVKVSDSFL